jgi:hypothetical protein
MIPTIQDRKFKDKDDEEANNAEALSTLHLPH